MIDSEKTALIKKFTNEYIKRYQDCIAQKSGRTEEWERILDLWRSIETKNHDWSQLTVDEKSQVIYALAVERHKNESLTKKIKSLTKKIKTSEQSKSLRKVNELTVYEKKLAEKNNIVPAVEAICSRRGCSHKEARKLVYEYRSTLHSPDDVNDGEVEKVLDAGETITVENSKHASKNGYEKFDKLCIDDLLKQSTEDLRKYASNGLSIAGASKLPGGKTTLVAKILEIRNPTRKIVHKENK